MGLEATLICVDNSEWMRNGDFVPSRLQVQEDAANTVCLMKTRQNVENSVGLLTLSDPQVKVTLTNDTNKVFKALQAVEPTGSINFVTGIRIAHLALKHRQNKNQKVRIVAFIGSPVDADEKDLIRLAKRLKKEKVNVDIVNFGEDELNAEKLTKFIDTLNGKEQTSHLVTAHPGPLLSEVLMSSPILAGEDGAPLAPMGQGFEFGIDPTEDPELAVVLRVSMEEQRQRQEDEARRALQQQEGGQVGADDGVGGGVLAQADLASLPYNPDVYAMTDEQQMALAMQMSLATQQPDPGEVQMETSSGDAEGSPAPAQATSGVAEVTDSGSATTATDDVTKSMSGETGASGEGDDQPMAEGEDEDMDVLMQNPDFIRSVLSSLPGVNPEEAIQNLEQMEEMEKKEKEDKDEEGSS